MAREYKDEQKKDTIAFGTTGYAAPEQYGKAQTDARTDIYGIGATMWHLLGGSAPPVEFPLPNVREANPNVGEGFADVIIPKCTQLEREMRYQTCEELVSDLEVYQELTREYKAKQRRKVTSFAGSVAASVLLVIAGFACLGIREGQITQNYQYHMDVANARVQIDPEEAQTEYLAAIHERPDAIDAYRGLINSYKVDSKFTPEEKQQIDEVYNDNLAALQASSRFPELSYELGRLYWYFYNYGQTGAYDENQATRIKASLDYFTNASQDQTFENYATAQNYANIATFVSGIDSAVMQGDEDKELYAGFWESLNTLDDQIENEPVEVVKLDSCVLIANSIETYMNKFKNIGEVSEASMEALLERVSGQLAAMKLTTEENTALRDVTLARLNGETTMKLATLYSGNTVPGSR